MYIFSIWHPETIERKPLWSASRVGSRKRKRRGEGAGQGCQRRNAGRIETVQHGARHGTACIQSVQKTHQPVGVSLPAHDIVPGIASDAGKCRRIDVAVGAEVQLHDHVPRGVCIRKERKEM